jgi:hypothetical protein
VSTQGDGPGAEAVEKLRQIGLEELEQALIRFWAKVGDLPDVNEHFAAAVALWLSSWAESYLLPDAPVDPQDERWLDEQLRRARAELELHEPRTLALQDRVEAGGALEGQVEGEQLKRKHRAQTGHVGQPTDPVHLWQKRLGDAIQAGDQTAADQAMKVLNSSAEIHSRQGAPWMYSDKTTDAAGNVTYHVASQKPDGTWQVEEIPMGPIETPQRPSTALTPRETVTETGPPGTVPRESDNAEDDAYLRGESTPAPRATAPASLEATGGPAGAATIWDVEYGVRVDVSQATKFYGDGAYEFLLGPDYTAVSIHDVNWVFLGYYGQVALPKGFPTISFPPGYDQAVVVPVPGPSSGTVAPSAPTNLAP